VAPCKVFFCGCFFFKILQKFFVSSWCGMRLFFLFQNVSHAGTVNNNLQVYLFFSSPNVCSIPLFICLMTSMAAVDLMKYTVHRLLEPSSICGAHSVPTKIKYIIQLSFLIFIVPRSLTRKVFSGRNTEYLRWLNCRKSLWGGKRTLSLDLTLQFWLQKNHAKTSSEEWCHDLKNLITLSWRK